VAGEGFYVFSGEWMAVRGEKAVANFVVLYYKFMTH
jgi:hypothetical protein